MEIEQMLALVCKAGEADRSKKGQVTLKYLRDVLQLLPQEMPCVCDTGDNFGNEAVEYIRQPAWTSDDHPEWNQPEYDVADSATAYPSAYRGYYSDCTFNAEKHYAESTVGHVLGLVNGAIGKTFNGYKGGLNKFTESTLVWGGSTSHSSCGDSAMIAGVKVVDGKCVLETKPDDYS